MKIYGLFVFVFFTATIQAQSGIELYGGFLGAQNFKETHIWKEEVDENFTSGFELSAAYTHAIRKNSPLILVGQMGLKQLYFSGHSRSSEYLGNTSKLWISAGGRYMIDSIFSLGIHVHAENNRDFEDFRTQTSDNLRYSGSIQGIYWIYRRLGITIAYNGAIYPIADHYLIFNPAHQFKLGLNYKLP